MTERTAHRIMNAVFVGAALELVAVAVLLWLSGCAPHYTVHNVPQLALVLTTAHGGAIYRGGQPTTDYATNTDAEAPDGWEYLRWLGVDRDIKLNTWHEGSDAGAVANSIAVEALPIDTWHQILGNPRFTVLRAAHDACEEANAGHVVFIHCTHGNDRTGVAAATIRRLCQGWTKGAARREMSARGYHWLLFGLDRAWWGMP